MEIKTGLWKKISKSNITYLQGSIEIDGKKHNITIFNNNNKKNDNSPDATVLIEEWKTQKPEIKLEIEEVDIPF